MKWWFPLVLVVCCLVPAMASHFRYGTISWWIDDPSQPNVVTFRVNTAWRDSYFGVNINDQFTPGLICYRNGTECYPMTSVKQSEFLSDDWMTGQIGPNLGLDVTTYTHAYPPQDGTWIVDHSDCCRIGTLSNNAGANWRITALVKISMTNPILRSPVSNTLPIVPVKWGVPDAQYQLSATPINASSPFRFRMATGSEQGDSKEQQPANLILTNDTTGLMTFNTQNVFENSLWTTQQIIEDINTGIYIPIDYIIQVKKFNTFCHPNCSNGLTPCTSSTSCLNCGSLTDSCVSSLPEVIYVGKTPVATVVGQLVPANGGTIQAPVDTTLRIDIVAHDAVVNDPTKPVTIYVGSLPPNSTLLDQIVCTGTDCSCPDCNQPRVRTITWTPNANQLGDHTVCIGVRSWSGAELSYSQHCFTIAVARQICSRGSLIGSCDNPPQLPTCYCNCPTGFDPMTNCLQCNSSRWGSNCNACPSCSHGSCDDGLLGSGACQCEPGWSGVLCDIPTSTICSTSTASTILRTSNPVLSRVNPATALIYMQAINTTTFSYNIGISIPAKPVLDIVLAQDVSSGITQDDINALNQLVSTFLSGLVTNTATTPLIGIATFSNGINSYRRVGSLTSDTSVLRQKTANLLPVTPAATTSTSNSLDALVAIAGDSGYGWRSDSFKIAIILTNKNSVSVDLTQINAALVTANVVPIFLQRGANFASIVSGLGYGLAPSTELGTPQNNWITLATTAVQSVLTSVVVLADDPYGVVSGLPSPTTTLLPSNLQKAITLQNPTSPPTTTSLPVATISVMGWGQSRVTVAFNRQPVPATTSVVTDENNAVIFSVGGSDPDNNILSTVFTALPTSGTLKTLAGVSIVNGTIYPNTSFQYVPASNFYTNGGPSNSAIPTFTFALSDGCIQSTGTATGTIRINFVNQPPTSTSFTTTQLENSNSTIDFDTGSRISDPDDATNALTVRIVSVPASIGTLYTPSGAVVTANTDLPSHQVVFAGNLNQWGIATFTYQVHDPKGAVSATRTVSMNVTNTNQPPTLRTATGSTMFSVFDNPGYCDPVNPYANCDYIELILEDPDIGDTLSISFDYLNCDVDHEQGTCAALAYFSRIMNVTFQAGDAVAAISSQWTTGVNATHINTPIYPGGPYPTNQTWSNITTTTYVSPFLQRISIYFYYMMDSHTGLTGPQYYTYDPSTDTYLSIKLTPSDGAAKGSQLAFGLYPNITNYPPRPYNTSIYTTNEDTTLTNFVIQANAPGSATYNGLSGSSLNQLAWGSYAVVMPPTVTQDDTYTKVNSPGTITYGSGTTVTSTTTLPLSIRNVVLLGGDFRPSEISYPLTYTPASNFHGTVTFFVLWRWTLPANTTATSSAEVMTPITITVNSANDPPTTSDVLAKGYQDTNITIDSFTAQSIDWAPVNLSLVISSLPSLGALYYSGIIVTVNQTIAGPPSSWSLVYRPPAYQFSVQNISDSTAYTTFQFNIKDQFGGVSNTSTCSIVVVDVDDPPSSQNVAVDTDENNIVQISFPISDPDGQVDIDQSYAVILIPEHFLGTLWVDQQMSQQVLDGNVTGNGQDNAYVWYLPPIDTFSYNTDLGQNSSNTDPLESFSFKIETNNAHKLQSLVYTASMTVKFVNQPPRFIGELNRLINEDTTDDIVLRAQDDNTLSDNVIAYITALPVKGVLRDGINDEAMPITGVNETNPYRVSSEGRQVSYTPGRHENGNNYASFTFQLVDSLGTEATYTINYNVTPVNTAPDLVPINFGHDLVILEGQSASLLFNATDADDTIDTLGAMITTIPLRGSIYACLDLNDPCTHDNSSILTLGLGAKEINLTKVADGQWGIHFAPLALQSYATYTIAFRALDPHGAQSDPYPVAIRVLPVNDPPVITVQDQYDTFISQAVNLFPSVADPDAGILNILVSITIQSGGPVGTAIDLTDPRAFTDRVDSFRNTTEPPFCSINSDRTNITCIAPQLILSDLIGTLQFIPTSESNPTTILFYANDLGAGGNPTDPNNNGLTDNKSVIVTVEPQPQIQAGTNNLTWTAVAAAGGGILIAVIIGIVLRRKLKKVDEEYFDVFKAEQSEGVLNSPLYKENQNKGDNATFDGRSTVEMPGDHDGIVGPKPDSAPAAGSAQDAQEQL